jgi:hypothetical protein
VGLPPDEEPSKISQYLRHRARLWQSRGIPIDGHFEKNARCWYREFKRLDQVADRIRKPLHLIHDKAERHYQGKIRAMGTLDKSNTPHLMLETDSALLAIPMKQDQLQRYTLNQVITLQYRYQPIQVKTQQRQYQVSLTLNKDKDASYGKD